MSRLTVYDCMIFLQAVTNPDGPSGRCVALAWGGVAKLIVSTLIMAEVEDVLTRPRTRRKFPALTTDRVEEFLRRVRESALTVETVPELVTLPRDPKDAKYLDLAATTGAEFVVSRDNDLLDLMTGSDPDAVSFRENHPTVRILDPVAFLRILDADTPPPTPEPLP